MTTVSQFEQTAQPGQEIRGRSLWADAWTRLRSNRAAVAGAIVLAIIGIASVLGPILSPHDVGQVYRSYIKVPASTAAYPGESDIPELLRTALRRSRADITSLEVDGDLVTLTLASEREIDPRITRSIERNADFANVQIIQTSPDGLSLTMQMEVARQYFLFGTDANGRDLLTRTLFGGRISLMIGLLATFVSLIIGVTYGATAGFIGGRVDNVMMRIVDVLYSIPFMFFVILLMVFFGRNIVLMFIAVGAVEWLDMARIVRGQTLSIKRREFIEAAHACGVSTTAIIRRHIVPNTLGPVVVYMTLLVPKVILLESFLSFLGLGVQEPMTSWGVLISEGANNIVEAPWMLIFPATFLALTLFAFNFVGDGLRDALDPKDR